MVTGKKVGAVLGGLGLVPNCPFSRIATGTDSAAPVPWSTSRP